MKRVTAVGLPHLWVVVADSSRAWIKRKDVAGRRSNL